MRALITGVTGQDGSYLAEQLDEAGWQVFGLVRGQHSPKWEWITSLVPAITLLRGDLLDQSSLQAALAVARPDVVFNLGALSFVGTSWLQPAMTSAVTGLGALRMLEAIRFTDPGIKFVQASSSEMFGQAEEFPQDKETKFRPQSPYAIAKVFAHHITVNYRESYGIHASTAISFNHESPRRGEEFVTRKISRAVARIACGQQKELVLGRLDPQRDWGWAPDYTSAMPLIADQDVPGDYVLATGISHSVEEFCEAAFAWAGLDYRKYVRSDEALFRPAEVDYLQGDPTHALDSLGWQSQVVFKELVARMVGHDMELVAA